MIRVVFMGTPEFAVTALEALIHAPEEFKGNFKIVGAFTQPDRPSGRGKELKPPPVKTVAEKNHIRVYQPLKLSAPEAFAELKELKPDIIVVVAYGQILKKEVIDLPRLGCVNIHSSLLPRWRGAAPIQRAILAGDKETGVTTMKIVEELDAGDIYLQSRVSIYPDDTGLSIHDKLAKIGGRLIVQTLVGLIEGSLQSRKQDPGKVTYAKKLTKDMEWLDWKKPAEELDRQVRALFPWPGTSVRLESGERLKVRKVKPHKDIESEQGVLLEKNGMVLLGTQQGSLELKQVQWDGKPPVEMPGFINGLRGKMGPEPIRLKLQEIQA